MVAESPSAVHPARQARLDSPATTASQEAQETLAQTRLRPSSNKSRPPVAKPVLHLRMERLAHKDPRDRLALLATLAHRHKEADEAHGDHLDLPDLLVSPASLESPDRLDSLESSRKDHPKLARRAPLDRQASPETREPRDSQDSQVIPVAKDRRALRVSREAAAIREAPARQGRTAARATEANATIARRRALRQAIEGGVGKECGEWKRKRRRNAREIAH